VKLGFVLFLLISGAVAQDLLPSLGVPSEVVLSPPLESVPNPVSVGEEHPIIFPPEQVSDANNLLESKAEEVYHDFYAEQLIVEQNQAAFLYDNWTLNLTNSTGLFYA